MPTAPEGATIPRSSSDDGSRQTVTSYLEGVVQDNDRMWTNLFTDELGFSEPFVSYRVVQPGEQLSSNCRFADGSQLVVTHDTPNAFYCSGDELTAGYRGTIYLPVTTMQKMWTGNVLGEQSQRQGDFAAAIITAHEFGHHVVDELRAKYSERDHVEYVPPGGKWKELIADCLAGVWAAHAYYSGYLEPGDFEEATTALEAIGDYELHAPDHHGTPEERREAIVTGYRQSGALGACVSRYWKPS
ncbi:neutral zinc metallopeptidase [Streptomyces sp. Je 1-79]|uniref:neutral zinc metallopeptidase n=1 Tax=Streptomyces sp. Je 1-79 TaxID=2943847 RepID=UPI0021A71E05|nr:neutral zinc metallopeptidase [Streptomyces sp. Je 1-79]MCT4353542.1 neutral zinc metallopeptidase [Streptomyces sp. Je 1-79]